MLSLVSARWWWIDNARRLLFQIFLFRGYPRRDYQGGKWNHFCGRQCNQMRPFGLLTPLIFHFALDAARKCSVLTGGGSSLLNSTTGPHYVDIWIFLTVNFEEVVRLISYRKIRYESSAARKCICWLLEVLCWTLVTQQPNTSLTSAKKSLESQGNN